MTELLALLWDWSLIIGYVAGLTTGYIAFFKEDEEETLWDKKVALHRHKYTHH